MPLVVRLMSSRPSSPSEERNSATPLLTSGSPPVTRTFTIPSFFGDADDAKHLLIPEDILVPELDTPSFGMQ